MLLKFFLSALDLFPQIQVSCSAPEPKRFVTGECQGNVDHLEEAESQEACLELCKSGESCRWFTFHHPTSACILYHSCDTISEECNDCVSGESRCDSLSDHRGNERSYFHGIHRCRSG
jgi:hypothetical protein